MVSNRNNINNRVKSTFDFLALTLIIFSLLITVSFAGCMEEPEYREFVRFSIAATASGPSEIIVPIPLCNPVLIRLGVTEGKGDFSIGETIHGRCMKINFNSRIVVSGTWSPDEMDKRDLMTINLTTMDPNETEPYSFSNRNWDIPDRAIWINWSYGPDVKISIFSTMQIKEIGYDWMAYRFYCFPDSDSLELGWNKVLMEASAGMENAP